MSAVKELELGQGRAGRAGMHPRCQRCGLHDWLCLCGDVEPLRLRTRVVVLTHEQERRKPTNTGRLAPIALHDAEVRIRGRKDEPMPADGLDLPSRRTLVLYPAPDAEVLTRELVERDPRPVTLVVPDGNWRQAARMPKRIPELAGAERVILGEGPPSRYRLRSHKDPGRIATLEAVARALGVIEGPEAQAHLERVFDIMVERTLWTRGQLPGDQVTGGLPPRPQ